jgi:hypothetical protein
MKLKKVEAEGEIQRVDLRSRFLRTRLMLPLGTAAAAALGTAVVFPSGGFFLNLGTELLGILLTVGGVDLILRHEESRRWHGAHARIAQRLEAVANVTWSQFRVAFGFNTNVFNETAFLSTDPRLRRSEGIRIAENIVVPAALSGVRALDRKSWMQLDNQLRLTSVSVDRLVELFSSHFEADVLCDLLELQDHLTSIISLYSTWPDMLGVPDDELPPSRDRYRSRVTQREAFEEMVADHVRGAVAMAVRLLKRLNTSG